MFATLKDKEKIPFSGDDIIDAAKPVRVKILVYEDLAPMTNIKDLFSNGYNAIALLYQTSRNNGHWVTILFDHGTLKLTFYDSYGFKIDEELKLEHYNHEAHLTRIVANSTSLYRDFEQNTKQMQAKQSDINTCGRYTALRCRHKDMSNSEFNAFIKPLLLKHTDDVVTMLTLK